jgi:hypothetical protein
MIPLRTALAGAAALLTAACAPTSARSALTPAPDPACVVPADTTVASEAAALNARGGYHGGDSTALDTRIAVTAGVDSTHAPWARNHGERLVFAQLYEPLVRVDCSGRVIGALAASWNSDAGALPGTTLWRFVLRHDARFSNDERVVAADVIASWQRSGIAHGRGSDGPAIAAIAAGARALDDSTLAVQLLGSDTDPRLLAAPAFAVAHRAAAGGAWPDGSTSYEVNSAAGQRALLPGRTPRDERASRRSPAGDVIALHSRTGDGALRFMLEPDADPRDLLDAGTDVLITASPGAVQYARTRPELSTVTLPWTRSYALALHTSVAAGSDSACTSTDAWRPLRDAMAVAVHVDARGAAGPCWWLASSDAANESSAAPAAAAHAFSGRIVYRADDPTARELAERIVALVAPGRDDPAAELLRSAAPSFAGTAGAASLRASGMDSSAFAASLAAGADDAYIVAIPHDPDWRAAARARLFDAAPWLAPRDYLAHALIPLVDTRERLIFRRARGIPRMTIMHDGTVIFGEPDSTSYRPTP